MTFQYLEQFYQQFPFYLEQMPYHRYVCESILTGDLNNLPNCLLYGPKGFPSDILIEYSIACYFNTTFPIQKRYPVWNQLLPYIETNYYFCIDTEHPEFPKEIDDLIQFIKNIVQTKCIHLTRHIIVLKNMDQIANRKNNFCFRVLLERFSQNVLFINTTHHIQMIEAPLLSRMTIHRVPLPKKQELWNIISHLCPNISSLPNTRNLCLSLFHLPNLDFSTFHYPHIAELKKKKMTPLEIRQLCYKIFQYQIPVSEVIEDCLNLLDTEKYQHQWILESVSIEHRSIQSDPVKKYYYMEWVLHLFQTLFVQ
uniref:Replication factor C C-terminal domain-containing protein n=1 Tax=viral metagenome TaxID=1070528 RepID=A0A6C0CSF2_9ZZZZ